VGSLGGAAAAGSAAKPLKVTAMTDGGGTTGGQLYLVDLCLASQPCTACCTGQDRLCSCTQGSLMPSFLHPATCPVICLVSMHVRL
jgi:hypothetical protein